MRLAAFEHYWDTAGISKKKKNKRLCIRQRMMITVITYYIAWIGTEFQLPFVFFVIGTSENPISVNFIMVRSWTLEPKTINNLEFLSPSHKTWLFEKVRCSHFSSVIMNTRRRENFIVYLCQIGKRILQCIFVACFHVGFIWRDDSLYSDLTR